MNSTEAAEALAEPIGTVGSYFYFAPPTKERAAELGLDVTTFYVLGRGGVLLDPTPGQVDDIFHFFKPGLMASIFAAGSATHPVEQMVPEHLKAADHYAQLTFGAIPLAQLDAFSEAAESLIATLPVGRWPLADGYRTMTRPSDPVNAAYRNAIILREVRGGVHTDAVKESGLTPVEACYLDREGRYFALHGFTDDDIPAVDEHTRARREAVEEETTRRMATLLEVLTPEQLTALVECAQAMRVAVKNPVPVA